MEQVRGVLYLKESRAVNTAGETLESQETEGHGSSFESLLQSLLSAGAGQNVSEEALFAALVAERVAALKGEEAGAKFKELLLKTEESMKRPNGYIPYEDAARVALREFQNSGSITAAEADEIHSQAFAAAQLDENTNALYDDIGSANDPTKAVQEVGTAIAAAKTLIEKYGSGEVTAALRPLSQAFSTSGQPLVNPYDQDMRVAAAISATETVTNGTSRTGNPVDGPNGFLFKPVSSNNGKLAVLMPENISRQVVECVLKDSSGRLIEKGCFWAPGFGAGGEANPRKKFSFTKPGSAYPPNLVVEATLVDGSKISWNIPDPSRRYD